MDVNTIFENKFLAVKERKGYYFYHISRSEGHLVAIVPYRVFDGQYQYLARIEICPAHNLEYNRYSITGGVNKNETSAQSARRELLEESGYDITEADLICLGVIRESKQSDTIVDLFSVDLSEQKQLEIKGDGSQWESDAGVEWITFQEGLNVTDSLFVATLCRLKEKLDGNTSEGS